MTHDRVTPNRGLAIDCPTQSDAGTWRFSRAEIDGWIRQQSMDPVATEPKPGGA